MGKGQRVREGRRAETTTECAVEGAKKIERLFDTDHFYLLRYLAVFVMFIDHLAVILASFGMISSIDFFARRAIGRLAFPLFALQLVESFHSTNSRKYHLLDIFILALVSELPFDIALNITTPTKFDVGGFYKQNTCFTLALAFAFLICFNFDWDKLLGRLFKKKWVIRWGRRSIQLILMAAFALVAWFIYSDYAGSGILTVALFEVAKHRKHPWFWRVVGVLYVIGLQLSSVIAFVPAALFVVIVGVASKQSKKNSDNEIRHKRLTSKGSKMFCRWFYPIHLTLLAIFRVVTYSIMIST